MRKIISLAFLIGIAVMATGCGTMNMQHGDVFPGGIIAGNTYPSMKDTSTRYQFSGEDIEVLGTVEGMGEGYNILFLFSIGDNGYQRLLAEAKRKYPDTEALINMYWDTDYIYVGWPYPVLPIFQRARSVVTATAIKLKRR